MYCSNCGASLESDSKFFGNHINSSHNINQNMENFNNTKQSSSNNLSTKNPWQLYLDTWKHIFNYQGVTSRRGF